MLPEIACNDHVEPVRPLKQNEATAVAAGVIANGPM
jgi:hypothetical protein